MYICLLDLVQEIIPAILLGAGQLHLDVYISIAHPVTIIPSTDIFFNAKQLELN